MFFAIVICVYVYMRSATPARVSHRISIVCCMESLIENEAKSINQLIPLAFFWCISLILREAVAINLRAAFVLWNIWIVKRNMVIRVIFPHITCTSTLSHTHTQTNTHTYTLTHTEIHSRREYELRWIINRKTESSPLLKRHSPENSTN